MVWRAFNKKTHLWAYRFGTTNTKSAMEKRLKKHHAPKHIIAKKLEYITTPKTYFMKMR